MAAKLWTLRLFHDDDGRAGVGADEIGAPLLVISQFTLYGDTRKGRRPSWTAAAPGPVAEPLVDEVVAELRRLGATVATGRFGAMMRVSLVNEGPTTVLVEPLGGADRAGAGRARVGVRLRIGAQRPCAGAVDGRATTPGPPSAPTGDTTGSGPMTVAMVSPSRRATTSCSTACSEILVRASTRPSGSTMALNPVGAAWSTHRPLSMARSRLDATCWVCTWVSQ